MSHKIDSILKDYYLTVWYSWGATAGLMSGYGLRLKSMWMSKQVTSA
jgi:hypothetical protein